MSLNTIVLFLMIILIIAIIFKKVAKNTYSSND